MSHLVETMAYVGQIPWHGLGNCLPAGQPVEVWQREAGLDWSIQEAEVLFNNTAADAIHIRAHSDAKVLYRRIRWRR
ncbi:hypothetical protein KIF53_03270 [Chromobacterium subtsugae]|uniref:Uncharacterized protein n=1 Tax=Chromobacterium subtsugae TaxID=251747 RepID=A0ABS7F999_9NEIS|nr:MULTISPECIES: hypothetical protein [Chromobacterium]MBW7565501.1 hypothetical protein [Chromobacterium subtsugae]MBW8286649.1 hypothetical protein [Chromobacterium subtsugae]WSE90868.1 hypothetical protein U6115_18580 [Chromobacterium subtsugae]WVH59241.1 hypothetical protein U6151_18610 [Chromobacterium subtsugae]